MIGVASLHSFLVAAILHFDMAMQFLTVTLSYAYRYMQPHTKTEISVSLTF